MAAYDAGASTYAQNRQVHDPARAHAFAASASQGHRLDLGCGPGLWFPHLGRPLVGVDASMAMLDIAHKAADDVELVQADLGSLPFADGSFTGIWANKCLQHIAVDDMEEVLTDLHRVLTADGVIFVEMFSGTGSFHSDDDLPGRLFTLWELRDLAGLLRCVGFDIGDTDKIPAATEPDLGRIRLTATRHRIDL